MDDALKIVLIDLLELVSESFNRAEMILLSDGSAQSKQQILEEIARSQQHIRTVSATLRK